MIYNNTNEITDVDLNPNSIEDDQMEEAVFNTKYKDWPFKPEDWLIAYIFNKSEIIYNILIIKDYKYAQLSSLVYDIYGEVEKIREMMEEEDSMFQKKKQYLLKAEKDGNKNIQIPLEGEYNLKKYVTLYKIYEFVGWFSKLRNETNIFKLCILEKQKLIEKIMPIADLSIRKVIGAKVVSRNHDQFEDAVSNAWVSIINFMPKIDPSRVMFSLFVSIANKSSYFFMARHLKHVYNTIPLSVLEEKMNQDEDVDGDFFVSSVMNKNEGISLTSSEDDIISKIDYDNEQEENSAFYGSMDIDMEEIFRSTTLEEDSVYNSFENVSRKSAIEQRILAYSFTILSGKIRKLCYQKIYAEFFIDLIEQKINKKVINKYADLFLNVLNFDELSNLESDNNEINDSIIKMLKGWVKSKQEIKLEENVNKINKHSKKVEREQTLFDYIRDNNKIALKELLIFRKNCIIFKLQ